ncbi:fibrobacter succinogenes major paralogous domain-containing protein [Crocinitomicaceae bacterium]|nr:fibrobacter succinogenes major paralogous domain-containing protein [Crocinitomicaceae bacterium]
MKISFILVFILNAITLFGQVKDIDGDIYKTVKIGNQFWMAENLNVTRFRNGDSIYFAKNEEEWNLSGREKNPAWCYPNFDDSKKNKETKLYNYFAVKDIRGLAPYGWRIPDLQDFYNYKDKKTKKDLITLLNKNKNNNNVVWGWWTETVAEEKDLDGILLGGCIVHCGDGFLHTNEKYLPENAFNVICIKE